MWWAFVGVVTLGSLLWLAYPRAPESPLGYGGLPALTRMVAACTVIGLTWIATLTHALAG